MCLVPAIGSIIKPMICTHGSMVCCLVWGTNKKRKPSLWFAFVNQKYSQFLHFRKFMISSFQNVPENQFQKDIFGYWENLMSGQ